MSEFRSLARKRSVIRSTELDKELNNNSNWDERRVYNAIVYSNNNSNNSEEDEFALGLMAYLDRDVSTDEINNVKDQLLKKEIKTEELSIGITALFGRLLSPTEISYFGEQPLLAFDEFNSICNKIEKEYLCGGKAKGNRLSIATYLGNEEEEIKSCRETILGFEARKRGDSITLDRLRMLDTMPENVTISLLSCMRFLETNNINDFGLYRSASSRNYYFKMFQLKSKIKTGGDIADGEFKWVVGKNSKLVAAGILNILLCYGKLLI